MNLDQLASILREYEGVTRKKAIAPMICRFAPDIGDFKHILASFGEDAAVIDHGEDVLLLAADGVWDRLMKADPWWAGYCAVLVNLHDIAAMGGTPIAMVDVFSVQDMDTCNAVSAGILEAVNKFSIPLIGGHIHPRTEYNILDIAILGTARKNSVIYSHTAHTGDEIIMAVDLHGETRLTYNWDSTTHQTPETLKTQLRSMHILGEKHLLTAGKDISNPGLIGTLGMLLEVSKKGATIDMNSILIPEGLDMADWLRMYPGMGFIVTCPAESAEEVISLFESHELSPARIGQVTDDPILKITDETGSIAVFDFSTDSIMGDTSHEYF